MSSNLADDTIVATRPLPGIAGPSHICFSPCHRYLTFLRPKSGDDLLTRYLYYIDLEEVSMGVHGDVQVAGKLVWDPAADAENENNLSLEDKLRRERTRQMSVGITHYAWSSGANSPSKLMIPLNGNIFIKEVGTFGDETAIKKVFDKTAVFYEGGDDAHGGALDPNMSPDGQQIAFVRDSELYAINIFETAAEGGGGVHLPVRLTYDSRGHGKTSGLADFVAQEEMDRYHGFWWSPDSQFIAFELVDESHIPEFRILHLGKAEVGPEAQEDHRYPFAGKANPRVKLGVVNASTARPGLQPEVMWLDLNCIIPNGKEDDFYLARVDWLPDMSLSVQLENRLQTELFLVRYDISTGVHNILLHETSEFWINLHDLFLPFESKQGEVFLQSTAMEDDAKDTKGGNDNNNNNNNSNNNNNASTIGGGGGNSSSNGFFFIWGSERTGFRHLYLYYYKHGGSGATLVRQLTNGPWMVAGLVQIHLDRGLLYYSTTAKSPLERHVHAVKLFDEFNVESMTDSSSYSFHLTNMEGINNLIMDHECKLAVWNISNIRMAPTSFLCKINYSSFTNITLEKVCTIHDGIKSPLVVDQLNRLAPVLRPPEFLSVRSKDNAVMLHGCIYRPDQEKYGPGPYPLIVAVYGGPHVQRVLNSWEVTADMRAQRFADAGYLVLKLDNRGSSGRGLLFEGAIKHRMGSVEVEDQVDGVNFLVQNGLADPDRCGIYGWSYGGYMSALCLMKRPDVFHVAVSGAPVTSWDGYDTHYTERYMGTPGNNPQGYEDSSVMNHVNGLHGKLMLVHGLIDENVHFRHTARLINALIAARKPYDLLLFPDERHSPRKLGDRIYMEKRIKEYFDEHLRDRISRKKKVSK